MDNGNSFNNGVGSWQKSTTNATQAVTNMINSRDKYITGYADDSMNSQYSVVGINATKVGLMRDAIREYVNGIKTVIDSYDPLQNANNAFKSEEVQTAYYNHVSRVKEYCNNLASTLLAFSDKLAEIEQAWQANMSSLSGKIDETSSRMADTTAYTEQK